MSFFSCSCHLLLTTFFLIYLFGSVSSGPWRFWPPQSGTLRLKSRLVNSASAKSKLLGGRITLMSFVFVRGLFEQNIQNYYNSLDLNSPTSRNIIFLSFFLHTAFFTGKGERG